jgi:uncharacterized protein (UPF0332 family)
VSENRDPEAYLRKAFESLAGAQSEFDNERFNNCTHRLHYAAFQAAISALLRYGIRRADGRWPHTFVQSEFNGKLINRQRRYPSRLRDILADLQLLRHQADYDGATITRPEARDGLRRSRELIEAIRLGRNANE